MNKLKVSITLVIFAALTALFVYVGCTRQPNVRITGTIVKIDNYGQPVPSFTPQEMLEAGFNYGDLIAVRCTGTETMVMPFVTAYTEAGIMGLCFCDYGGEGKQYGLGLANGSWYDRVYPAQVGDTIIIMLYRRGGYMKEYEMLRSVYTYDRADYASPEVFANFREVNVRGIAPKRLYRSSNPLSSRNNPVRYAVADSLARVVGIRTEIDLADTPEFIQEMMRDKDYASTYCPALFRKGQVFAQPMAADAWTLSSRSTVVAALRFMINHEPPYLIHCNEGKDRCGYVNLVIAALMGASLDEIQEEYMTTFCNYYHFVPGTKPYELLQKKTIQRMVYLMAHPSTLDDLEDIRWSQATLHSINLEKAATRYLLDSGLTISEINTLKKKLQ